MNGSFLAPLKNLPDNLAMALTKKQSFNIRILSKLQLELAVNLAVV